MEFIDLKAQYKHLKTKINDRIRNVLKHGKYIMGPEVFELEEKLSDFVGVKNTISCANGTDALTLSLMALDVKSGDAVFCPTFTFFATAEVIGFSGATPIFVDSDLDTFNISPPDLEKQIRNVTKEGKLKPKAIITVDLFGLPADYPKIKKIAKKYNLILIEDSAQGFGGEINGKKACTFGDISTTSFFPAKPLGCYGDGGAVFTDNNEYAELIRSFRVHGKGFDKYDNIRIGMNSRLDTIQAAILLEKLNAFPLELIARHDSAMRYNELFKDRYKIPTVPKGFKSSWAQYTLQSDRRADALTYFSKKGVPTVIYYGVCMHQQTAFNKLGYSDEDFPNASKLAKNVFSLPMHGYIDPNATFLDGL